MIDESTITIIDNPIMIDKSTMTIDENKLIIFLHAAKVAKVYHLEMIGQLRGNFNIPNYEQERKKGVEYWDIVHDFIKKYSNYSINIW